MGSHGADRFAPGQENTGEIDTDHPVPVGKRGFGEGPIIGDAGAGDAEIKAPQLRDGLCNALGHAAFIRHVQLLPKGTATCRFYDVLRG